MAGLAQADVAPIPRTSVRNAVYSRVVASDVIGIALTGAVGVAGILSTHLLARSQRKVDAVRVRQERHDRYRFSEHQLRTTIYADYVAELRSLTHSARLRLATVPGLRQRGVDDIAARARQDSLELARDDDTRSMLASLADMLERNGDLRREIQTRLEQNMPPPIDTVPIARRLAELEARISLVGHVDMVDAARRARDAAIAFMMGLEASELTDFETPPPLDELEEAMARLEEAAIYELRLTPYGERQSLAELRAAASQAAVPE